MDDLTNINDSNDIMKPLFTLNINQKNKIENYWKNIFTEFKNTKIEIFFSHNVRFPDGSYLSNKVMYLRLLNENEIKEWMRTIIFDNKKEETIEENNILLLIYKKRNLNFRLISQEGKIFSIKYIPINENIGIRNYDVYIVKI